MYNYTMKMEDLTKTQVILLTLLVSFVTSIATGIVTVALMDQAPQDVTRTINRVVERTVEYITPAETPKAKQEATVITKETTVVVKEEDLITDALKKNSETLVRIYEQQGILSETGNLEIKSRFVGLGVIISSSGVVATDSSVLEPGSVYKGVLPRKESSFGLTLVLYDPKEKTGLLQLEASEKGEGAGGVSVFPSVRFADISSLKIGQTALSLGGEMRDQADIGILSSIQERELDAGNSSGSPSKKALGMLGTSIRSSGATGGPLLNIFGELMGVSVIGATNNPAYVPASVIADQLAFLKEKGPFIKTASVSAPAFTPDTNTGSPSL